MINKTYQIKNIHCKSCKTLIESVLEETPGIKKVDVEFEMGRSEIEFDESKISEKEITKKMLTKILGSDIFLTALFVREITIKVNRLPDILSFSIDLKDCRFSIRNIPIIKKRKVKDY